MGRLDGRIAIVTGAGRGLGRAHALALAREGAAVVVNDRGGAIDGTGASEAPAAEVSEEITAAGGRAVASFHDVANWDQAGEMVELALETFGDLHVLVNNAGILRDRTLSNMTEEEWDAVIRVHLKGHAAPSHHALAYWKRESKAGRDVNASIIHTSSLSGYCGNFGQANYASAKLGIAGLSRVIALENARMGVRSNCVSPGADTRLAQTMVDTGVITAEAMSAYKPEQVSTLIAWLAEGTCPANSQVFHIGGNRLVVSSLPPIVHALSTEDGWTLEQLDAELPSRLVKPTGFMAFMGEI